MPDSEQIRIYDCQKRVSSEIRDTILATRDVVHIAHYAVESSSPKWQHSVQNRAESMQVVDKSEKQVARPMVDNDADHVSVYEESPSRDSENLAGGCYRCVAHSRKVTKTGTKTPLSKFNCDVGMKSVLRSIRKALLAKIITHVTTLNKAHEGQKMVCT